MSVATMAGEIKTATTTRFRRYSALTTWAGYLNATMLTCDAVVVGAVSELTSKFFADLRRDIHAPLGHVKRDYGATALLAAAAEEVLMILGLPEAITEFEGMRLAEWQVAPGDLVLDGLLRILGSDGLTSVSRLTRSCSQRSAKNMSVRRLRIEHLLS
ncbi:unnamed protein product [Symbiodinium microadriaticum]|nr:unnamed protein product [Symbiodinium microadriaticum]